MYDSHIHCEEYKDFKNTLIDVLNGDDTTTDVEALSEEIQELYNCGKMSSSQYDDLMSLVQDLL